MKKHLLLASQRIEVGALIRGSSLNPRAFRWAVAKSETTGGAEVTRLEYAHPRASAYFQFDHYRRQHYALYCWGEAEGLEEHFVGSWPHQVLHVARWMAHLEDQARKRRETATA
ncbi:MAG TPA: hypothetical protein VFD76_07190 [Gemmatimonadales bacterium]|nr:hypothetical protein [Gemmatimonadales bacterium]